MFKLNISKMLCLIEETGQLTNVIWQAVIVTLFNSFILCCAEAVDLISIQVVLQKGFSLNGSA